MPNKTFINNSMFPFSKNILRFCLLCIVMSKPLTACSEEDMKTVKWREEVKLASGQIIIAEQTETYRTEQAAQRLGTLLNSYRIQATFPAPISTTVYWDGHLKPLAIDIADDGNIYLVVVIETRQGRREYSVPDSVNHVAFRYNENGQWERVLITSIPQEIKPNLFVSMGELFVKRGYPTDKVIDLPLKQKIDSDPRIDRRYRSWLTK